MNTGGAMNIFLLSRLAKRESICIRASIVMSEIGKFYDKFQGKKLTNWTFAVGHMAYL